MPAAAPSSVSQITSPDVAHAGVAVVVAAAVAAEAAVTAVAAGAAGAASAAAGVSTAAPASTATAARHLRDTTDSRMASSHSSTFRTHVLTRSQNPRNEYRNREGRLPRARGAAGFLSGLTMYCLAATLVE